jgi:hypothetical protein
MIKSMKSLPPKTDNPGWDFNNPQQMQDIPIIPLGFKPCACRDSEHGWVLVAQAAGVVA